MSYRLSNFDIANLVSKTPFEEDFLLDWHDLFQKCCPNGRMNRQDFKNFYKNIYGKWNEDLSASDRIIDSSNDYIRERTRADGIDFNEFSTSIGLMLRNDLYRRLNSAFDFYDLDRNEIIDHKELDRIVKLIYPDVKSEREAMSLNQMLFKEFNSNRDNVITRHEFINACLRDSHLRDLLLGNHEASYRRTSRPLSTKKAPEPPVAPVVQPQPMPQPLINTVRVNDRQLRLVLDKYKIKKEYAGKLKVLLDFKTIFILDDSSSMNASLKPLSKSQASLNKSSNLNKSQQFQVNRWSELQQFTGVLVEIANIFNTNNATDLYFLNNPPCKQVKSSQDLASIFNRIKPNGNTQMTRVMKQVLNDNVATLQNEKRNLLIIVITDGEPTNENGEENIEEFRQCLVNRKPLERIYVSIISCTDDPKTLKYLADWDKKIKNLDVVDDFATEKKKIKKVNGCRGKYEYGDHVVRALLGSILKEFDQMNDKKRCTIL